MWENKEIEENLTLDFALDFCKKIFSFDHLPFPFPFGSLLILLTNLKEFLLNLRILSHDKTMVNICKIMLKRKEKQIKREW